MPNNNAQIAPESITSLLDAASKIIQASTAKATKAAYKSDMKQFFLFAEKHSLPAFPASPETVYLYLTYMNALGRKPSTIRRAVTSIKLAHRGSAYPSPIDWRTSEMLKGINRLRGTAQKKRSPITLNILRRLIDRMPTDFIGIRDRALILTGWTGALRRSEIVAINVEDFEEREQGLILTIRRSKTDQEGKGRKIGLPFIDAEPALCAPRAIAEWRKAAFVDSGPLFRSIGMWGRYQKQTSFIKQKEFQKRLSAKRVWGIVRLYIALAGYDPRSYGAHSLRSGLATTLAEAGIQERNIMNITGHKSLPVLREYIDSGQIFRDHPVASIFLVPPPVS